MSSKGKKQVKRIQRKTTSSDSGSRSGERREPARAPQLDLPPNDRVLRHSDASRNAVKQIPLTARRREAASPVDDAGMDAQLREYQLAQQREEAERKERMKQAKAEESARKKQEAAAKAAASAAADSDDDEDYEDDFDDYSDEEFESDDEGDAGVGASRSLAESMDEVLKKPVLRAPGPSRPTSIQRPSPLSGVVTKDLPPRPPAQSPEKQVVLPISKPKPRNISGIKHRRADRVAQLKQIIQFQVDDTPLFAQAPLPAFDLYFRRLSSQTVRQSAAQTRDTDQTIHTQTEPVVLVNASMQFPDDIGFGSGSAADIKESGGADSLVSVVVQANQESENLRRYLRRTAPVMDALLQENSMAAAAAAGQAFSASAMQPAEGASARAVAVERGIDKCFSSSSIAIQTSTVAPQFAEMLQGRRAVASCFSDNRNTTLAVAYTPVQGRRRRTSAQMTPDMQPHEPSELEHRGLICVWNIQHPDYPTVLLCDSTPTSCAFSPGRSHVVIVGTSDGHVLLWDLREPTTRHTHPEMAKFGIANGFRSPTYMTEAGTPSAEAHASPIVRVVAIGKRGMDPDSTVDSGGAQSDNAKKGLNALGKGQKSDTNGTFQVASIDDRGLVNIWTAVELDASRSASDTDLGLALGGRLKLVRAGVQYATAPGAPTSEEAIISLPSTAKAMACLRRAPDVALGLLDEFGLPIGPSVTDMDVCPSDSSPFVVACTSGQVLHRSRAGEVLFPSSFARDVDQFGLDDHVSATCVAFNPSAPSLFLAGYSDAAVCLYSIESNVPVTTFALADTLRNTSSVRSVAWLPGSLTRFLVLNNHRDLFVYDLLTPAGPVAHASLAAPSGADPASASCGVSVSASSTAQTGPGFCAVVWTSGSVMVYALRAAGSNSKRLDPAHTTTQASLAEVLATVLA